MTGVQLSSNTKSKYIFPVYCFYARLIGTILGTIAIRTGQIPMLSKE